MAIPTDEATLKRLWKLMDDRTIFTWDEESKVNEVERFLIDAKAKGRSALIDKPKRIAAAEHVAREIRIAYAADEEETVDATQHFSVLLPKRLFTAAIKDGYRKMTFFQGHGLAWKGQVRVGATGNVLFIFEPEMNMDLRGKGVTHIEVPHDELSAAIGATLPLWLEEALGCSVEDAIQRAMGGGAVSRDEEMSASLMPDEPEPPMEESEAMEDWGAWS